MVSQTTYQSFRVTMIHRHVNSNHQTTHHLLSQPADNTVFTSRAFRSTAPRLPFTARLNSQHLQTTPQDSSVLLHHCHSLTNHTTSAYNSNLVRHMARYKCSLLPCLLTFLYFRLINMVDKFYCSSSKQRSMTTTAATSRRQMTKVM